MSADYQNSIYLFTFGTLVVQAQSGHIYDIYVIYEIYIYIVNIYGYSLLGLHFSVRHLQSVQGVLAHFIQY